MRMTEESTSLGDPEKRNSLTLKFYKLIDGLKHLLMF